VTEVHVFVGETVDDEEAAFPVGRRLNYITMKDLVNVN
jgi:hypothetical protein